MIDLEILEANGASQRRLMEIFTSTDRTSDDWKIRDRFEKLVAGRVEDGLKQCARHSSLYQAVDMAWDSTPIQKESIPLLLYAQGRIDLPKFAGRLKELDLVDEYCKVNDKGEVVDIDFPKLVDVRLNLVRSYVTRRMAAQSARFANLYPYFRYEPRSTSNVGKLRADVLSQRVEIMSDQYGYRHLGDQCSRDMFLYSHTVVVPTWDREVQWRKKNGAVDAVVTREGVDWRKLHPSRTFWDRSAPLAQINTDTGPAWIADWDIVRFGALRKTDYFNLDKVESSSGIQGVLDSYPDFFTYYFEPTTLSLPSAFLRGAASNDRSLQSGAYTTNDDDKGVVLTRMAMRIVPKDEGIGDYPYPVWLRLTAANDNTIVHAEFLPSLPACYGGINEHDDRLVNPSFAVELLPYQDAGTNIMNHLLLHMKASLFQLWAIDTDSVDEKVKVELKKATNGSNYFQEPQLLYYSASKLRELGITVDQAIKVIKADLKAEINAAFGQLLQLLSVCDRLMVMSQNEIGQAAPREISAREVTEIASTTDTVYSFIGNGIDELRAAMKRVCYESLVMQSTSKILVPVVGQYTTKTVERAGFKVLLEDEEGDSAAPGPVTVIGSAKALDYDYVFSSRDGAERASNPQAAQTLVQLAQMVVASPALAEKLGLERLFDLYNEIFRLSGAAFDLRMELKEGETGELTQQPTGGQQGSAEITAVLQGLSARIAALEDVARQAGLGGDAAPQADAAPAGVPAALLAP